MSITRLKCAEEAKLTCINTAFGCAAAYILGCSKPITTGLGVGAATAIALIANKILSNLFPGSDYHRLNWGISFAAACLASSYLFSTSLLITTISAVASTILSLTLMP